MTGIYSVYLTSLHPPKRGPGKLGAFGRNFGSTPEESSKAPGRFGSGGKKSVEKRLKTDDSTASASALLFSPNHPFALC